MTTGSGDEALLAPLERAAAEDLDRARHRAEPHRQGRARVDVALDHDVAQAREERPDHLERRDREAALLVAVDLVEGVAERLLDDVLLDERPPQHLRQRSSEGGL